MSGSIISLGEIPADAYSRPGGGMPWFQAFVLLLQLLLPVLTYKFVPVARKSIPLVALMRWHGDSVPKIELPEVLSS